MCTKLVLLGPGTIGVAHISALGSVIVILMTALVLAEVEIGKLGGLVVAELLPLEPFVLEEGLLAGRLVVVLNGSPSWLGCCRGLELILSWSRLEGCYCLSSCCCAAGLKECRSC